MKYQQESKGRSENEGFQTTKPTKELALNTPLPQRAHSERGLHLNKVLPTTQGFDSFT
jgi:hypothetical protein